MQLEFSAVIPASPGLVFALLTDLDQHPKIFRQIKRIERLTPAPYGVGTRYREIRQFGRCEAAEEFFVEALTPPQRLLLVCVSRGVRYESDFTLIADHPHFTTIKLVFRSRPIAFMGWLLSPLSFFMTGTVRSCIEQDLRDLHAAAATA